MTNPTNPTVETITIPEEFLVRWDEDGKYKGCHLVTETKILIDGEPVTSKLNPPVDLGLPTDPRFAEIVGQAVIDQAAKIERLEAKLLDTETQARIKTAGLKAEIDRLTAQIEAVKPPSTFNWQGLMDALRGTPIFGKAIGTANGNFWSLLLNVFSSASPDESRWADLRFAIAGIRAGLTEDFTPDELAQIAELLEAHGFPQLG